jgi:hypothetical protein
LDDETRGFIEKVIDGALETDLLGAVDWIRKEIPISSVKDLTFGFHVGLMYGNGIGFISLASHGHTQPEDLDYLEAMIKRRFPELLEKIKQQMDT